MAVSNSFCVIQTSSLFFSPQCYLATLGPRSNAYRLAIERYIDGVRAPVIDLNTLEDGDQRQTVQLAPCGTAKAKLVDRNDKPFVTFPYTRGAQPLCILVVEAVPGYPFDPHYPFVNPDSIHWTMEELAYDRYHKLSTDKDGNIVFPLLIPDSQYVLYTYNAGQDRMFFKERKRFKVAAGEQLDLGTILTVRE